jgi:hypothetical protein
MHFFRTKVMSFILGTWIRVGLEFNQSSDLKLRPKGYWMTSYNIWLKCNRRPQGSSFECTWSAFKVSSKWCHTVFIPISRCPTSVTVNSNEPVNIPVNVYISLHVEFSATQHYDHSLCSRTLVSNRVSRYPRVLSLRWPLSIGGWPPH